MPKPDFSAGFVKALIKLTNQDKLIWEHRDLSVRRYQFDSDLAYREPWILCLDSVKNSLVLQVAESFNCFTEFSGPDYGLGELNIAIALQRSRMGKDIKTIADDKIAKFVNDKVLKAQKDLEDRETVLGKCSRALRGEENE